MTKPLGRRNIKHRIIGGYFCPKCESSDNFRKVIIVGVNGKFVINLDCMTVYLVDMRLTEIGKK